ncbi:two-component system sporulation sensor kinase B [Evansella vedderi]|uniref:histidine kinase n=1 Tax=Evansella vedderi TaxID=38282 RepID=A0ABT9ZWD9_9BACI|nr:HAMP domain-containing sensor histidine kinase [Evansella vedderi]MDQ0254798.1 two-component system sporulation sensor kinase B [Evansella vedderi]
MYYRTIYIVIIIMLLGLFVENPRMSDLGIGYIWHVVLVAMFIPLLLLYPRFETQKMRIMIIAAVFVYFYSLFLLYGTWSIFLLICLIPAISILFFDSKLFYFSLIVNGILVTVIFFYIDITAADQVIYPFSQFDLIGSLINFMATQVAIYLIFYLTYERMKKIQVYYEEIRQSEQLRATGQLAAAVAHEIRNPLTVVKGFLQYYEQDNSYSEKTKQHFHLMIDELNSAEKVISQYLSLAKPNETDELETVNIKSVLQSVTHLLQSYGILRNNHIDLHMEEDCFIAANKLEFKQLLINIIKNAIEVSKDGDSVIVQARKKENNIEIKVKDYGIGMSEAEIKSLGTPFYSLKSKGTGLGLMICFNIVEKYNGFINFESTKGKGTTVTLQFPVMEGSIA